MSVSPPSPSSPNDVNNEPHLNTDNLDAYAQTVRKLLLDLMKFDTASSEDAGYNEIYPTSLLFRKVATPLGITKKLRTRTFTPRELVNYVAGALNVTESVVRDALNEAMYINQANARQKEEALQMLRAFVDESR